MTSTAAPPLAPEWAPTALRFIDKWEGPVCVAGDRATDVAQVYHRSGAPPVVFDGVRLAYLTTGDERPADGATAGATGLPDDSVQLVTLRRAWRDGAELAAAAGEAYRILRPGGHVILSGVDADVLLGQQAHRYPLQLVYRQVPEAAAALRAGYQQIRLPVRAMAAGYRDVVTDLVDETLGTFATPEEYVEFLRTEGADRLTLLSRAQAAAALENLPAALRAIVRGDIVHREPWAVAAAVKP